MIRPARAQDLPRIAEVERSSFSTPWSVSSFRTLLTVDRVLFRVLEEDGVVMGHGVLWRVADEGELANIAIHPDAQRRGLGTELLEHLLQEAAATGVARVFLDVRESNVDAIRIYRRRGFREVGRRTDYYQKPVEDALILRLDLDRPSGADPDPSSLPPSNPPT